MSYIQYFRNVTMRAVTLVMMAGSLLLLPGYSYGESASDYVSVPPLINATASGDKPNVLIVLDNSNSMDEAPSGQAVGSANPGSKSEIARGAVKGIINSFGARSRLGLMAYKQQNVIQRRLHDSQYDVSFDPDNYDPDFTGDRASQTKNKRVINPTDTGNFIHYNVALPFYSGNNLGNAFCYSNTADFDNGSEGPGGPFDTYDCYRTKTGTSDNGRTGLNNFVFRSRFQPTDSDFAQNILDFGTYLTWQYVSRTWFSNESPGQGYLHVAIDDVDATHESALMSKLDTSQFTSNTDTPLRNAGLTPIAGTLESAGDYFVGSLASSDAASGVSTALPPANQCGVQNFVVLVTDGLPSVDKNGNKVSDTAAAIQASADEAASLLSQGIRTYVVGFGLPPGVDGSLLDSIAEAGGTEKTLLANDSETLNNALSGIFLDIFNRASSSSAAAVLANNARGEGAVFQALYSPSIQDSSGAEVTWTGSLFGLFIDQAGLLREDTNGNAKLDGYNVDRTANYVFNASENKTEVELFLSADAGTPPDTEADTPVATVELNDIKPLWRARDQLSAISDPVTQRSYDASAANGRYILTSIDGENTLDFKPLPSEDLGDLVDDEQEAKSALDTADAEYAVAQAQYSAAQDSVDDQQAVVNSAGNDLEDAENNILARQEDVAEAEAETASSKTVYESALSDYKDQQLDQYNDSLTATSDFFDGINQFNTQKSESDSAFDALVTTLISEGGTPSDPDVQDAKAAYDDALNSLEARISGGVVDGLNDYQAKESAFESLSADTIADCIETDMYRGTECQSDYESATTDLDAAFDFVEIQSGQVVLRRQIVKDAGDAYVNALIVSGANENRPAVKDAVQAYNDEMTESDAAAGTFDFYSASGASAGGSFRRQSTEFRGLVQDVIDTYSDYKQQQDEEAIARDELSNAVVTRGEAVTTLANEEQSLEFSKEDREIANTTLTEKATALAAAEQVYREAFNNTFLNYLDTASGEAANNVVRFVRGEEGIDGFRNRTIDYDDDGTAEVWRLGDIVNSTPALVAGPNSGYDVLYRDETYAAFREKYKDRRNVVYVGGNDGMLHAFNAGFWNGADRSFQTSNGFTGASQTAVAHPLGAELWSYIPKAALPHLQWLTNPNYAHTYYVDGQPLVFDANIFPDDETHPNGWGTVLVVGMGLGGGPTQVDSDADGVDDQTLRSSYIVLDITDPEQPPELMAEITHPDLGFTTGKPALFKQRVEGTDFESPDQNNWYLVFGSGPTDMDRVTSDQQPRVYVYDLEAKAFESGYPRIIGSYTNSFVGDVSTVDWDDDYLDDTAYYGIISGDPLSSTSGAVERLRISSNGTGTLSTLLNTGRPVTASPHLTKDGSGRKWVYFGTGRLFSAADNVTAAQNRFYGLYEPVDSSGDETSTEVNLATLFDITDIEVKDTGAVSDGAGGAVTMPDSTDVETFNRLKFELPRQRQGWYRDLENDGSNPTERSLSRADSIRSVLFYTTYKPSANECTPEGSSRLFGVDFQTGVAPPFGVFSPEDSSETPEDEVTPPSILLGQGLASAPTIVSNRSGERLQNSDDSVVTIVTQSSTGQLQLSDAKVGSTSSSRQSWREITK